MSCLVKRNTNKIPLDKYYTSSGLARYVIEKVNDIVGGQNITEYLEPSAGQGVFLDYLNKPYLAYDIEPDDERDRIKRQDFLELDIKYKEGRCIIGNPPFGSRMNLVVAFYKKSIQIGDYIAFILPVSQLNNNIKLYEFDLIYSEDLGMRGYSDREIHCSFNIYRRNPNGFNKKSNYKLKDVEIKEDVVSKNPKRNKRVKKEDFNYDIRISFWGASTGNEVEYERQYSHEFCIKIKNLALKDEVLDLIKTTNWIDIYPKKPPLTLYQWQVYKYLKEQIPELE